MEKTLMPSDGDTWGLHAAPAPLPRAARLTILFHADLWRIGASTALDAFQGGHWVTVGRAGPDFLTQNRPLGTRAPLGDPYISRQQLQVRWLEPRGLFEVAPSAHGRRPVAVVNLAPGRSRPTFTPIRSATCLEPGSLIAIGNRVLLLLDCGSQPGPDMSRLGMIGETSNMWDVRREILKAADFDRPVLVLGPTGTGKEVVSRALHQASARADEPFVPVNCAAVPEHLAESLLFGHRKGAFTGADASNAGVFRDANGGTLFLDEVGELPTSIQAKLLRTIQEGTITPVGASRPIPVDVRVVAATNRDPRREIAAGNLRADFFYRLSGHTITLPSLEARRWDIPLLFVHFMALQRVRHPGQAWMWAGQRASSAPVPMAFFVELMRRQWPGNIRELLNAVDQTLRDNLHGGPFVLPAFSSQALDDQGHHGQAQDSPGGVLVHVMDKATQLHVARELGIARKTFERVMSESAEYARRDDEPMGAFVKRVRALWLGELLEIFVQQDFNQVRVAEALGVSRTTLVRLMTHFGIPREQDLSAGALASARVQARGDVGAMARVLGLDAQCLRAYLDHKASGAA
mgnify:CR=1 FL=1